MRSKRFIGSCLCALTASLAACGDERDRGPGMVEVETTGRGSATCHEWQTAVCSFSEKCGVRRESECLGQSRAIACVSDERARACADALNSGTCVNPPQQCDLRDLADTAPAIAACDQLMTAFCEADHRCGRNESVDDCKQVLRDRFHCDLAVGVRLEYEACIAKLGALSCSAPAPGDCNAVILE